LSTIAVKSGALMTGWNGCWLFNAAGNGVPVALAPVDGEGALVAAEGTAGDDDGEGEATQPAAMARLARPAATARQRMAQLRMAGIVALPAGIHLEAGVP
jgi:hypothetical protein